MDSAGNMVRGTAYSISISLDDVESMQAIIACLSANNWVSATVHYVVVDFSLQFPNKTLSYYSDEQYTAISALFEIPVAGEFEILSNIIKNFQVVFSIPEQFTKFLEESWMQRSLGLALDH